MMLPRVICRARRRLLALVSACLVIMLVTACTAGTAGGGSPAKNSGNAGGTDAAGGDSSKVLTFFPCCSWNTTWSFNPYNVNQLGIQNDFITMRLAIAKAPSLTEFVPQLADKWAVENGKLNVHLRDDAKWQDGTPVTSKDLHDTAILNGLRGDGFWNDITGVDIVDDKTVAFTLKEGQPESLAKLDILNAIRPYPSSVYGQLVTDELKQDVIKYFRTLQQNPEQATKLAEARRMGDAFKNLAALKVDKLIGNGPFRLENITTKEAKLVKWDGFWDADQIKFAGIRYLNGSNQTVYPQLFSGNVHLSNVYMPPPILNRWKTTPNSNTALSLGFGFAIVFNSNQKPLDSKAVRQALAYVIPRQQISEAAYGTDDAAGGTWKEVSTGISPTLEELYLKPEQIEQLNKYPVDAAKATELLQGEGFTKKGDQWMKPDGKPFTITFTANAETSDIVTSFNSAAKALTAFGIKSEVNATSGAQQDADQHNGDFQAGMAFVGGSNPLGMYNFLLGPGYNFTRQGNYAGKRGIGFGPKKNVPGLGEVDVASTIDRQVRTVEPGEEMNKQVWNWAQLVNEEVPYIWYATKVYQFPFSTKDFTNWPPLGENNTSELWDIISADMTGGLSLAMQQGYITPKP
ncbi:extracellular solute-binding protein family 5 [Kribbella flavida DSM 17836]|uniref:Extracellular solute-binding protein family 5 n=2 Tax=Kribbella flavida TaxID=182640 RepID=D2Q3J7_KRIFD|nr:extracellular solute-binding protein family 5 [Kribbella flavida DSM 17836]